MNSNDFINWLKGYLSACGPSLSMDQMAKLKETLKNVSEVSCPQQVNNFPYNPPGTWGTGVPLDPNKIWFTSSTGTPHPLNKILNENND
jgi:hypothetical protein